MEDSECIFCAILDGKVPAQKAGENEGAIAFYDLDPSASAHVLLVPKTHRPTFLDLDGSMISSMTALMQKIIRELKVDSGYRLIFNGGKYQHIPHVHWHLLGGEFNDLGKNKFTAEH